MTTAESESSITIIDDDRDLQVGLDCIMDEL